MPVREGVSATPTNAGNSPRLVGQMVDAYGKVNGETFSPPESDTKQLTLSTALIRPQRADENEIIKHVDRGAPGDATLLSMVQRGPEAVDRSKRKSKFYGEVFAYREPTISSNERITQDSIITAEVKTNVIIKDEYSFMTDLTEHLAQRYSRPTSSIAICLDHSACLVYGGSFDPTYILTISALPSLVQPTTNKRNAILIQHFFADLLGVPSNRGVLRFVAVPEANLATDGITVFSAMEQEGKSPRTPKPDQGFEELEKKTRSRSKSERRRTEFAKDFKEPKTGLRSQSRGSDRGTGKSLPVPPPMPPIPTEKSALDMQAEKVQRMGKRKSFLNMFGK